MDVASCVETDPELFFPELDSLWKIAQAKKICEECPVKTQCLEYALSNKMKDGIWGGTSPTERSNIIRRSKRRIA
jgi:WhiB family redox-sensing transcriptional regulator